MVAIIPFRSGTVLLTTLISYATAISSTSASSTPTQSTTPTSSPNATAIIDTTTPYYIEYPGFTYPGNPTWGIAMEIRYGSDPTYTEFDPFQIGDVDFHHDPENFTKCNENSYEILYASTNSDPNPPSLLAIDAPVVLSPSWPLQESSNNSNCTSFKEIPTVPFAFNLGSADDFNGLVGKLHSNTCRLMGRY